MGITIDEIIAIEQEMSKIFQKVVDTHMVCPDLSLEELYCDDTEIIEEELKRYQRQADFHNQIINIIHKYQQLEEFARWVAEEVIDEEMWEYNHLSFTELACRKLVKLGIVQESNGEYLYEVIEDGRNRL